MLGVRKDLNVQTELPCRCTLNTVSFLPLLPILLLLTVFPETAIHFFSHSQFLEPRGILGKHVKCPCKFVS